MVMSRCCKLSMDGKGAWRDNVSVELHGVMEVYLQEFGDSKYHPSPLLKQMLAVARLGRSQGRASTAIDQSAG
jgi:hypothetical protein